MSGGKSAVYTEAAQFEAGLVEARFEVNSRGPFEARLSRIVLGDFRLLNVEERGPRTATVTLPRDCVVIAYPTEGARRQTWDDLVVQPGRLIVFGPGARFRHSMAGRGAWAWIVARRQSINRWRRILSGSDQDLPNPRRSFVRLASRSRSSRGCTGRPRLLRRESLRFLAIARSRGLSNRN
jgi:hypothetical protein